MKEIIKLSKKGNNLEINLIIPLTKKRCNPYMGENEDVGTMDNVVGLIDERQSECGFAFFIDMDYKNKGDQWTDYFYKYQGDEVKFELLCKKLGISIVYI